MVVLATFLLTVFVGLTQAIVVGFALGTLLFLHRMAQSTGVESHLPPVPEDAADEAGRPPYDPGLAADPDIAVYRITGAFFFGAAAAVGGVLDRIRRPAQGAGARFFGRAVHRFHGCECNRGRGAQGREGRRAGDVSGASEATRRLLESQWHEAAARSLRADAGGGCHRGPRRNCGAEPA